MTTGHVTPKGLPVVAVELAGECHDAVIDTGSELGLQLPVEFFEKLTATPFRLLKLGLGAGEQSDTVSFKIPFTLDGLEQVVEGIFAEADEILVGVESLTPFRLTVDFPAGTVLLERVAPNP